MTPPLPPRKVKMKILLLLLLTFCGFMTLSMFVYMMKPTKCKVEECFGGVKTRTPERNYVHLLPNYSRLTSQMLGASSVTSPGPANTSRTTRTVGRTSRDVPKVSEPGEAYPDPVPDARVYEDRRKNLQRYCQKYYSVEEIRKIKKIKLNHILIDEKHKLLYCYVPKVACTNWKRVFLVLTEKAGNMTEAVNLPSSEIHAKNLFKTLQNYTIPEVQRMVADYTKFIFVRHPFERLLSAYRNKLEQHYDSSKYFQARFGKFIIKKFRKNPSNVSLEKGDDVTFEEFANYLTSSDPRLYNEHWQRVTDLCHPCLVNYDFIGKYETLEEDSNYLLRYLGVNVSFPMLGKPSTTGTRLKKYYNTLGKNTIYKLYSIYQMDFRLFGYDLFNTSDWKNN